MRVRSARALPGVLLAAGLCATLLPPPAAAETGPPPGAPASATAPVAGTGMVGYRLYDLTAGDVVPKSIEGIGADGTVTGQLYEPGNPALLTFSARLGPYTALPSGSDGIATPAGSDAQGRVYALDRPRGEQHSSLFRWDRTSDGDYVDPVRVAGADQLERPGSEEVEALDVSDRGDVLLSAAVGAAGGLWQAGGGLARFPLPPADSGRIVFAGVAAMSGDGRVVGATAIDPDADGPSASTTWPTLWASAGAPAQRLAPPSGVVSAYGKAVNDAGEVLVVSGAEAGGGWVRSTAGDYRQLAVPDTARTVRWEDLNDRGEVVGTLRLTDGRLVAAVNDGTRTTVLDDLVQDRLAWQLKTAAFINQDGVITGEAVHEGRATVYAAVPVDPVVFLHGAGASRLASYVNGRQDKGLWLDCSADRKQLSTWPQDRTEVPGDIRAVDALRFETCFGAGPLIDPALDAYGTMLRNLARSGSYREYHVGGMTERFTSAGCHRTQNAPNLFVFAYDWRQDNGQSARQVADFMDCVRSYWPKRKIDVLTHSMGSLVGRRYLLDHPADHHVDRMVTIGAPWLGSPKIVNVLQTGDFAPQPVNGDEATIKHITGHFPSAHQLLAADLYATAAAVPVLREEGWDLDGDGTSTETYDGPGVRALLDDQLPATSPGTEAQRFQTQPGQVDWTTDDTGVTYTHVVGLRAGADTLGTTVARRKVVCEGTFVLDCSMQNVFDREYVCGDGTVPIVSAERAGRGKDYNPDGVEIVRVTSSDADSKWEQHHSEHTGLAKNPAVERLLLERLLSTEPVTATPREARGRGGDESFSCLGLRAPARLAASAEPEPDAAHSLRYLDVLGGSDLVVRRSDGLTTDVDSEHGYHVPGVTLAPAGRTDAATAVLPLSATHGFTTSFRTTGLPLSLRLVTGSTAIPTTVTHWRDVPLPAGRLVELATTPDGRDALRFDGDGDGRTDTVVPPVGRVTGADAKDKEAPVLSAVRTSEGGTAVVADDGPAGSGTARVLVSTDGQRFRPYEGPMDLSAGGAVTAFAEDRAGNRSAPATFLADDVRSGPLTTAALEPAPSGAGWTAGPVDVHLTASAPGGVREIRYSVGGGDEVAVTGARATVPVSVSGRTVLRYRAVAADGAQEPERSLTVRVDLETPAGSVTVPGPNAVVQDLPALRGTATDVGSGVARVEVSLRDAAGRSWDGTAWRAGETWLGAAGTTAWSLSVGLPAGDELPADGYRVRLRVTDLAGRIASLAGSAFTVAQTAGHAIRALRDPRFGSSTTSLTGLSDTGVAAAVLGDGSAVYANGRTTLLRSPAGFGRPHAVGVDDAGRSYGHVEAPGNAVRAVRWAPDGSPTLLAGGANAQVTAVDRTGRHVLGVVGETGHMRPALLSEEGSELLPLPAGVQTAEARDIATDGTAVGSVHTVVAGQTRIRPAVWRDGSVRLLPGLTSRSTGGTAVAVDAAGRVLVDDTDANGWTFPVLHDGESVSLVEDDLTSRNVRGHDLADDGTMVGTWVSSQDGTQGAWIAPPGGAATDLATLLPAGSGWQLRTARAVNALGQVGGLGFHDGAARAYVLSAEHAPTADDLSVTTAVGTPVDLVLPAHDPDVTDAVTITVTSAPEHGTLTPVEDGRVTYTPDAGFSGTDAFRFTAGDPGGLTSAPGTVTLRVGDGGGTEEPPRDLPPVIVELSGPETAVEGAVATFTASGTDPEGAELTFSWTVDGRSVAGSSARLDVEAGDGPGVREVTVTVTDGTHSVSRTAVLQVTNAPPVLSSGADVTTTWGSTVALSVQADDPSEEDRDSIAVTWSFGDGGRAEGTSVEHAWVAPGTYSVQVTATDRDGASTTQARTVTVRPRSTQVVVTAAPGPFGLATVRVQTTDGDLPLAGRRVLVTVDGTGLSLLTTGLDGSATLPPGALPVGTSTVGATAQATDRYEAATAAGTAVTVTQSRGKVTGTVSVAEGTASLSVQSDGRSTKGSLSWLGSAGSVRATLTSLGRTFDGRGAWLAGTAGSSDVLVYAEDRGESGVDDRLRLWVDGVEWTTTGRRTGGNVQVRD